jgi:DNA-binding SARP family transcriptional activator
MGALEIKLFGKFSLADRKGESCAISKKRSRELLAWLLLNRKSPQDRQFIAFSFWPDRTEQQALTNLRNALYYLRKHLPEGDEYIRVNQHALQWNMKSDFYLDVSEFESAVKFASDIEIRENDTQRVIFLKQAEELYKGPLLESVYSDWVEPIRERYKLDYMNVLKSLVEVCESRREFWDAILYANRLAGLEPFSESVRHHLMKLYMIAGERANAIRVYKEYEEFLEKEMNVAPTIKIQELFQQVNKGSVSGKESVQNKYLTESDEEWEMVGREVEWKTLINSWKNVLDEESSRMVILKGTPGIGKTRLMREFEGYLRRQGYTVISTRSYASAGSVNYGIVIDCLRHELIKPKIRNLDPVWLEELKWILPELKIENPDLNQPEEKSAILNQRNLLQALSSVFVSDSRTIVILMDDLQWADPESIAWLDYIFHQEESGKMLFVGAARSVEMEQNRELMKVLSGFRQHSKLEMVELDPLLKDESDLLMEAVTGQKPTDKQKRAIYHETEGNPLFIVEFLRQGDMLANYEGRDLSGDISKGTDERMLPDRISAVIQNRFQYLTEEARNVMEIAAVIGREFSFDILLDTANASESELADLLDELLDNRIIRENRTQVFDFAHDKIREVAYKGISRHKRRLFHKRIAGAYKRIYQDSSEEYSGRLAFHYEKADQIPEAIHWYEKAATNARNILSKQDVYFYRKAIELTSLLPESEHKIRTERDLFAGLAVSLLHQKEHRADEVVTVCERVRELCDRLGEKPAPPILFSFGMAKLLTGKLSEALETGKEMICLARDMSDSVAIAKACYMVGGSLLYLKGDLIRSQPFLKEGLSHYDPALHRTYMKFYDLDAGVILKAAEASVEWLSGNQKNGETLSENAFEEANRSGSPFNIVYIHYMMAWWQVLLRHPLHAITYLKKFKELKTTDYELFHWSLHSNVLMGWAKTETGSHITGIEMMKNGIAELKEYRFIPDLPYYYGLLAEVLGRHGEFDEAFSLIDEAKEFMEMYDVRFPEAEIYRAEGELKLATNSKEIHTVKESLDKAIKIARKQGLKLFEIRARDIESQLNDLKTV